MIADRWKQSCIVEETRMRRCCRRELSNLRTERKSLPETGKVLPTSAEVRGCFPKDQAAIVEADVSVAGVTLPGSPYIV